MYYWLTLFSTVLCDQIVKLWVVRNFFLHQSEVIIPGFFNLTYVTNSGAAFSIFAEMNEAWRNPFFFTLGGAAILALSAAWYNFRDESRWYAISFGLIAGGAIGNLIDRIRWGSVVDFLDLYAGQFHWPAFNVADSAICSGVVLYLWVSYRLSFWLKYRDIKQTDKR